MQSVLLSRGTQVPVFRSYTESYSMRGAFWRRKIFWMKHWNSLLNIEIFLHLGKLLLCELLKQLTLYISAAQGITNNPYFMAKIGISG